MTYDVAEVNRLITRGLKDREIADRLHISRNSVIGRRFRLYQKHPELRPAPKPEPVNDFVEAGYKVKIKVRYKRIHKVTEPRMVDFLDLRPFQCRWPLEHNFFCGADVEPTHSYCHKHCMKAYPAYALKHQESARDGRGTG